MGFEIRVVRWVKSKLSNLLRESELTDHEVSVNNKYHIQHIVLINFIYMILKLCVIV